MADFFLFFIYRVTCQNGIAPKITAPTNAPIDSDIVTDPVNGPTMAAIANNTTAKTHHTLNNQKMILESVPFFGS